MKPLTALLALFLSACAVFDVPPGTQDGTTWIKTHDALPYVWEVTPASTVKARCDFKWEHENNACAIRLRDGPNGPYCLILSALTEQEAAQVYLRTPTGAVRTLNGKPETLRDHEVEHCAGFNHEVAK